MSNQQPNQPSRVRRQPKPRQSPAEPEPNPVQPIPPQRLNLPLVIGALCLLAAVAGYFFWPFKGVSSLPEAAASDESEQLLEAVGRLIVLPEGEEPTIATVANLEALQGQSFFAKAKLGDKVLIFAKAGKAILYDPLGGKIVEVAPLSLGDL